MKLTVVGIPVIEDIPDIEEQLKAVAQKENMELMQNETNWCIGNQFFLKPVLHRVSEGRFNFKSKNYKFTDEFGMTFKGSLQDTAEVKSNWFENGFIRKFDNGYNKFSYEYQII